MSMIRPVIVFWLIEYPVADWATNVGRLVSSHARLLTSARSRGTVTMSFADQVLGFGWTGNGNAHRPGVCEDAGVTLTEFLAARQCACGRGGKLTRGMCARCYRYWLDHTPPSERPAAPRFSRQFWDFVDKSGPVPAHDPSLGPCWVWTGPHDAKGYGRWGKKVASRHSWTLAGGTIPRDLWVLHHCDNPPCVNPGHLYVGTVAENVRDMVTRGRAYIPPLKEVCDEGHEIDGDNLREFRTGRGKVVRVCRTCDNKRSRDRQRAIRAARRAA